MIYVNGMILPDIHAPTASKPHNLDLVRTVKPVKVILPAGVIRELLPVPVPEAVLLAVVVENRDATLEHLVAYRVRHDVRDLDGAVPGPRKPCLAGEDAASVVADPEEVAVILVV